MGFKRIVRVEYKSDVLGNAVFWEGTEDKINEIRNIPARRLAELVLVDGLQRKGGMWTVSIVGGVNNV